MVIEKMKSRIKGKERGRKITKGIDENIDVLPKKNE